MKKRILALVLATLMLVSLVPMTAFADDGYTITNGTPESAKETNHGYITVDETAAEGDEVEVTVVPNNGYKLKSLVYSPTSKTVADILPEEFPAAEPDVSGAPATAWKSATLDKLCYLSYDKTKLFFYTDAGIPDESFSINTDALVSADEDENYVYENGTVTVTFFMNGENGTLNSVTFANTANTTWDGTYQGSACVAAGTVITMYNGEQKKVEDLEIGDVIRTFDHEKGEVSSSPVCFIWESKNAANAFTLTFEGNINVTVIEAHGFYDCDENRYVFINVGNAKDYIGHHFYNADTDSRLELKNIEIMNNCIDAYAVATSKHLNHLSNGMLSMCDGTFEKIANLFEYDNQMKYDAELMKKDIEDYGLTPPEKVLKYKGFNKADYYDYNLQYLDIALGKGLISYEWIEALSEYCIANNIYDILPVEEAQNGSETKKMRLMSASAPKKMLFSAPNPAPEDSVEIKADTQGKYIFTMPGYAVTVTAEFEKIKHTHNPVKINGQAATETASGWKDYYKCDCGALFEDEACEVEITNLDAWKAEGGNGYIAKLEPTPDPDPINYKVIEGANSVWVISAGESPVFRSNADFSKFSHVLLDGKELAKKYYKAESGSTIVTLKPEYAATLSVGKHTIEIVSTDGSASTVFYIEETIANTNGEGFALSTATMSSAFIGCNIVGLAVVFFELKKKKKVR